MTYEEGDIAAFKDYQPPEDVSAPPPPPPASPAPSSAPPTPFPPAPPPPMVSRGAAGRVFASPFAKTIAAEQGVDLSVSYSPLYLMCALLLVSFLV